MNNSFSMPKRPGDQDYYNNSRLQKEIPDLDKEIKTIVDRLKKCLAPNGATLTTGRWSLDAHGYHTWRYYSGPEFNKHRARDVRKFALGALVEEPLVAQYRRMLFRACRPAAFLRLRLNEIFNTIVKTRRVVTPNGQQTIQRYEFADKIVLKTKIKDLNFSIDIDELIGDSDKIIYLNKARKTIAGLDKSIKTNQYARVTPGNKEVDPHVLCCAQRLERVCRLFLLSFFAHIIPRPSSSIPIACSSCLLPLVETWMLLRTWILRTLNSLLILPPSSISLPLCHLILAHHLNPMGSLRRNQGKPQILRPENDWGPALTAVLKMKMRTMMMMRRILPRNHRRRERS